jgi:hypothetical protein
MRANAFNRRLGWLLLVMVSAAFTNRIFGALGGASPRSILTGDLLIFAAISAAAAVTLIARAWLSTVAFVLGAAAMQIWPEQPSLIVPAAVVAATAAAIWALRRQPQA